MLSLNLIDASYNNIPISKEVECRISCDVMIKCTYTQGKNMLNSNRSKLNQRKNYTICESNMEILNLKMKFVKKMF